MALESMAAHGRCLKPEVLVILVSIRGWVDFP